MKGRASATPTTSHALAPGAALRLAPQGLLVSLADRRLLRVTSGTEATDAQISRVLDPRTARAEDLDLAAAGKAVLALLQQRHAVLPETSRLVWCDWTGRSGLEPSTDNEEDEASPEEGTMRAFLADATAPRLARWVQEAAAPGHPWTLAWLTPHAIAVTRNTQGKGCASCALFFDGELARTALPPMPTWSPWIFSPALLSLAAAMLQAAAQLPPETLPDHHAWWLNVSSLHACIELVPSLPGCACDNPPFPAIRALPARDTGLPRFAAVHVIAPEHQDQPWRAIYRGGRRPARSDRGAFGVAMAAGENAALRTQAEAIERFCMMHTLPSLTLQSAVALQEPRWEAERISSLLFSAEQYATPRFRFSPFHERLPLDWSWAERLSTGQRALVPTSLAGHVDAPERRLVDATSSGYAAHTERGEAISHALLELIERDALLLAWLAALPPIRLAGVSLPARCEAYLIPSGVGLPVVLLAAPSPRGGLRLASAAACTLSHAVSKALAELSVALAPLDAPPVAVRLGDPAARAAPADHVLHYDHPERCGPLLDWLGKATTEDIVRASGRWEPPQQPAAVHLTEHLEKFGLEAWVVDRSLPRLFEGWHIVRALVPGLVEISWGALYLRAAAARARPLLAGRDPRNILPHPFG